jgi:hypothetical protein
VKVQKALELILVRSSASLVAEVVFVSCTLLAQSAQNSIDREAATFARTFLALN